MVRWLDYIKLSMEARPPIEEENPSSQNCGRITVLAAIFHNVEDQASRDRAACRPTSQHPPCSTRVAFLECVADKSRVASKV